MSVPPVADSPASPRAESGAVVTAARAELVAAGRLESAAGQVVMALARRIDGAEGETGAAMAALVKEFRAALAEAVDHAEQAADPIDELRAQRERKRSG